MAISKKRARPRRIESSPETLAETPIFSGLDSHILEKVLDQSEQRPIPAGTYLFQAGEDFKHCVAVHCDGELEIRRANGGIDKARRGDVLGLSNYLDGQPYASSFLAITDCQELIIPAETVADLEREQPTFDDALNRVIAQMLRERSADRSVQSGALARPAYSVMKSPVASCGPGTSLREAFRLMQDRRIGSLVVTGEDGRVVGVLNYRKLSGSVILGEASPEDDVLRASCETPLTAQPDTPLWEIEALMHRNNRKYVVIVEDSGPVGIVSQTDILRSLISGHSSLITQIGRAAEIDTLAELNKRLPKAAIDALETNRRPSAAVRLLSETHLALQRRCIELTQEAFASSGRGKPPCDFVFIIMGSGGRKEMLINPDQDNGIIYADVEKSKQEATDRWFADFGEQVNQNLAKIGYILCPGEIMARNPLYRKTLSGWKEQIDYITSKPNDRAARWSNIMFDFDTLHGNDALTTSLRRHILSAIAERPMLLRRMAEHDAEGRPALGLFNRLITTTEDERGDHIDIKRNGLRIVADAARIYALQASVSSSNTMDRLQALMRLERFSVEFTNTISSAYEELLDIALRHQIEQSQRGETPDKLIDPDKLSTQEKDTLRVAMRAAKRLQDRLQTEFDLSVF
jgi:CBS domain-containing protein